MKVFSGFFRSAKFWEISENFRNLLKIACFHPIFSHPRLGGPCFFCRHFPLHNLSSWGLLARFRRWLPWPSGLCTTLNTSRSRVRSLGAPLVISEAEFPNRTSLSFTRPRVRSGAFSDLDKTFNTGRPRDCSRGAPSMSSWSSNDYPSNADGIGLPLSSSSVSGFNDHCAIQ